MHHRSQSGIIKKPYDFYYFFAKINGHREFLCEMLCIYL